MSEGKSERYRPPEPNQMFTLGHDKWKRNGPSAHQSTAGAVEVRDAKGRVVGVEKVKVTRYMAGKRPDWAPEDLDSDEEALIQPKNINIKLTSKGLPDGKEAADEGTEIENFEDSAVSSDPRLARLMRHQVAIKDDDEEERKRVRHEPVIMSSEDEDEKEDSDDEAAENRRELIRRRNLEREKQEAEVLPLDDDLPDVPADDESSEYETEYESEEDEGPRLKPVFVREKDRLTVKNAEIEEAKQKRLEIEKKKLAAERKKYTLTMIEKDAKKDFEMERDEKTLLEACDSDDGDPDVEFEAWKFRELQRLKRDREEREAEEAEQAERDRRRNMTEEERIRDNELNPRIVTNQQNKGKMKFLMKYYHRGAFYIDKEEDILKRDIMEPTLEDHQDKEALPDVMKVKNFGRSGRTKWTHLTAEDTTAFDGTAGGAWAAKDNQTHLKYGAGFKQTFERPSKRKKLS